MKCLRASRVALGLAAVSVATASFLLVAGSAEAETSLFRVLNYIYMDWDTFSSLFPPSTGPDKAPPASGYVGATTIGGQPAQRFTIPEGALLDDVITWYCKPGTCYSGYPTSIAIDSLKNLHGRFGPSNPNAPAPSVSVHTIRFPTTGGGDPLTPTTTFPYFRWNNYTTTGPGTQPTPYATYRERGNYDFDRGGSIRIFPGAHRFGGTMRYFYGPNSFRYRYITRFWPRISTVYSTGPQWQRTAYDELALGQKISGGYYYRYLWTSQKSYKATDGYGNSIWLKRQYIDTGMPWTTGDIIAYQWLGSNLTKLTHGGTDMRTSMGLAGTISMVTARVRHSYLKYSDETKPIQDIWHAVWLYRMDVIFEAPEPRAALMLCAGVATLVGLALVHHRRS